MRMLFSAYLPSFFFTEYNRNRPCFGYNKYHQQHNYYMSSIFFSLIFFLFLFSFFIITSFGIFSSRVSPRDRKCSDFPVLYFFFIVSLFPCYQKLPFFYQTITAQPSEQINEFYFQKALAIESHCPRPSDRCASISMTLK